MNHPLTQEEKQAAYDAWFIAEVDKGWPRFKPAKYLATLKREYTWKAFLPAS